MSKKHKPSPVAGYLKCSECGWVTEQQHQFQIGSIIKSSRKPLDCNCGGLAQHVSKEDGFDAVVRQQIEHAA